MRKVATWMVYSRAKQVPELFHWIMFSSYISEPIIVGRGDGSKSACTYSFDGPTTCGPAGNGSELYEGRLNWLRFIAVIDTSGVELSVCAGFHFLVSPLASR
jgi:hypothetical protein